MPTAAVVIIGDEILTGKFADENGPYLIERLRALGCDLRRLVVVSDELDCIADEVRRCSEAHDFVFTTGGVGPTHDDITLEGIARAFGLELELRDDLVELLRRFQVTINESTLRMATVPVGCTFLTAAAMSFPVLTVRNVYIFPGVPRLLQAKFEAVAHHFAGDQVYTARVYTDQRETEIAEALGEAQSRHPTVAIGSYPRFGEGSYRVIVTLEARDEAALLAADADLREALSVVELT